MRFALALLLSLISLAPAQATELNLTPTLGESFGVQVKETQTTDDDLAKIKAAGLSYVRFVLPWYEVEKGKGSFVWGYFEAFIERLHEHGLKAVIVLGAGHPAYTGWIEISGDNVDHAERTIAAPQTPEQIQAFAAYAARTVSHFGTKDIIWELWNEPDSDYFWAPKADSEAYNALAIASCKAIRAASPDAIVVGPGMADTPGRYGHFVPGFLGSLLRSPASACLNAVSVHPYRDGEKPPETVLTAYQNLRAYIEAFTPKGQKALPVLSTEWGFTLTQISAEEQAAFLLRTFLLNSLSGVPVSIWYEWRDSRTGENDPEAHFGLLDTKRNEKESFKALQAFLPPLADARIEERAALNNPNVFALWLRHTDGRRALVFWSAAPNPQTGLRLETNPPQAYQLTAMPQVLDLGTAHPTLSLISAKDVP